jgi:hypothetical protein
MSIQAMGMRKPLTTETLKTQRKSKAGKPERLSASLAFLCASVLDGFAFLNSKK